MGVLGLTPFLQKACPDVIKELPTRLRALTGKTIAIDGNLVTQRLHFGAVPHEYRHLIGWYRIVNDLRAHGVGIITVWDGKERGAAKAREVARRQSLRLLSSARGTLETARLRRLQRLTQAVKAFRTLESSERVNVARAVRLQAGRRAERMVREMAEVLERSEADVSAWDGWGASWGGKEEREALVEFLRSGERDGVMVVEETGEEEAVEVGEEMDAIPPDFAPQDFEAWEAPPGYAAVEEAEEEAVPQPTLEEAEAAVSEPAMPPEPAPPDLAPAAVEPPPPPVPPPPLLPLPPSGTPSSTISAELSTLYLDFQQHTEPDSPSSPSKLQARLTEDEQSFWTRLSSDAEGEAEGEVEGEMALVETLLARSGHMALSYAKRNRLPTNATYAECRRLLSAMGVPCIEAEYPYEAEALAASLVLNGYADVVGSEDTDVLVYEAPLLRNLTSRNTPLSLISGTAVREALKLSRSAYIDFALLLGTDFTTRVKNLGPHTAIKLIRSHGSIERVLQALPPARFPPPPPAAMEVYMEQIGAAREVFTRLPPVPEPEELRQREPDEGEVRRVLKEYGIRSADLRLVDQEQDPDGKEAWALGGAYYGDDPFDGKRVEAV